MKRRSQIQPLESAFLILHSLKYQGPNFSLFLSSDCFLYALTILYAMMSNLLSWIFLANKRSIFMFEIEN